MVWCVCRLTPRSELLNHVDSHIIHCTQCLEALKTMKSVTRHTHTHGCRRLFCADLLVCVCVCVCVCSTLKGYLRVGVLLGIIGASRLAGRMAWYSGGGMVACAMAMAAISAIGRQHDRRETTKAMNHPSDTLAGFLLCVWSPHPTCAENALKYG